MPQCPVIPAAEFCMKCSLYQFVSYMILALNPKSQTLGYFSLPFTHVQDLNMGFLSIIFLVNSSRKCFVFQIDLLLSFFLWSSDFWIQEWMPASIVCDDFLAILIELDWAGHFVQYMMYSSLDGLNTSEEV